VHETLKLYGNLLSPIHYTEAKDIVRNRWDQRRCS